MSYININTIVTALVVIPTTVYIGNKMLSGICSSCRNNRVRCKTCGEYDTMAHRDGFNGYFIDENIACPGPYSDSE